MARPVMEDQTVTRNKPSCKARWPRRSPSRCSAPTAAATSNANAAHPFENPTPLSNFLQMLSIFRHRQRADLLPRPHGEEPGARLVGLGGDDGPVSGRRARCAGGRRRTAIRSISNSASPPPTATWKARKSASASSTPRCSPRSPPTPPAARSTRCTIPSPRSAASCRCSTSSSAKSSSAASAPGFTACWSSSCSRCSSPG